MIKNYAIETEKGYVKWATILVESEEESRLIRVAKAAYTDNLQEAQVFTEEEKLEDLTAWEEFLGVNENDNFTGGVKVEVKEWDRDYFDRLEWVEVPMWKAMKLWANNQRHVKCVDDNSYHFYHGQEKMKGINHSQVKNGKWFVEKM
jgi:hypothetical protein